MDKVIFDTNAYRNLVDGKTMEEIDSFMVELKNKEAKNNIETLLSPIVAQELLSHLADKNDNAFEKCLKANKALYLHNGNPQNCNVFPSFEVLFSQMYFGIIPEKRVGTYEAIIQLSYHLSKDASDETFAKLHNNLQSVKTLVEQGEQGFIDSMWQIITISDPSATSWQMFKNDAKKRAAFLKTLRSEAVSLSIAAGYVAATHQILLQYGYNISLTQDELLVLGHQVLTTFPEPVALFKHVIEYMIGSEYNIGEESRANFVWDIALTFIVGRHKIEGNKLYFVTADKEIIRNAIKNNTGCYVVTLDEYLAYLS